MLLEVQCEVFTVSEYLGCPVICRCWSTVFSEVHSQRSDLPGNFRALHASFCWQALWRCWFHFPAGLGACPHCQRIQNMVQWPWSYWAWLASKLAWPEPHRESTRYCQSRGRWETPDPTMQMTWRLLSKQPWLPLHLSSATGWLSSMPRCIDAVIHAKGDPTMYWVHRNEHTFQKPDTSVENILFLLILCNIKKKLRHRILGFHYLYH